MPPSSLGYNQPKSESRAQAVADVVSAVQPLRAQAPWQGFVPDLDVAHLGASAARDIEGLIPRGDESGLGEVMGKFPGFNHVDSTYAATGTGVLGDHANTTNDITGLFMFARTNGSGLIAGEFDDTTIAITGGNDTTAGSCQVYRIKPSTGLWDEITEGGGGTPASIALTGSYPGKVASSLAQLMSFAVMPASPTLRAGLTAVDAGTPTLVFTNNHDNVKMYAVQAGGSSEDGTYEDLTEALGTGTSGFKARSVTAWGDRLNFLNTSESGSRHRQRLRRTAIGDPDPDPALDGSGAIDFQDFQEDGLRVEGLGNVLACYFGDGVAFVRRTFQSVSPYTTQIITKSRGLLSTHSLADLGGGIHFGLFTDGWFFLNENGQFQEAGIASIDGIPTPKWRDTFFNRLDMDERDRIDVRYVAREQQIYMTLPMDGATENQEVWVYDIKGDRVFTRTIPATKFGSTNLQLSSGTTIGSLAGTIGSLSGIIGSFAPTFGLESFIHGTATGMVVAHDKDLTTIIDTANGGNATESWKYSTVLTGLGGPRFLKTVREIIIEFVLVTSGSFTVKLIGNAGNRSETQTFTIDSGANGDVQTLIRGFRYSNSQIAMEITGSIPVNFRSIDIDMRDTGTRVRRVA